MAINTIQPMPKCLDNACINGVITYAQNGEVIQKLCKKCEQIEKDLIASEDYEVTIVNGRAVGYEIINQF